MQYGEKLAEGKTKIIYAHPDDERLAYMVQKDAISAGDGARRNEIAGKGEISGRTAANVFRTLNSAGIRTHFHVAPYDEVMLVDRCSMIPLEVVMRRIATGSYCRRNPETPEGTRFDPVLIEFFIKDDANHDPQVWDEDIIGKNIATNQELRHIEVVGTHVFEVLEERWAKLGVTLVDLKIEFGRNADGTMMVADMIDNDSWRLWVGGDKSRMLDKQIYRNMPNVTDEGLQHIKQKYEQVRDLTGLF